MTADSALTRGDGPSAADVLGSLRDHGWNATSFQALHPSFLRWTSAGGVVAYVDTGSAWVVAGAPIGPVEAMGELVARFRAAAGAAGRRVVFFAVEERFLRQGELGAMRVGEQPVWDPSAWAATVASSRGLREQIRRARAKGTRVRGVAASELAAGSALRLEIERLIERWVASRPMAPMGFLVELEPFTFVEHRRFYVATQGGRLTGFLAVCPVYARDGWFFENLLRDPLAPNGSVELLMDGAMRALAAEGARYVTLGLAPLAGEVSLPLRAARRLGARLYDFEGLRAFKAKLRPGRWDPVFVAFPEGEPAARVLLDTLRAFARGGLLRFGVQTLFRVPPAVVQALALMLVPWTLGLCLSSGPRWFPSPWIKGAWVLLDVSVVVGLWSLSARWKPRAATLLGLLVSLDALLTWMQALLWNLRRTTGAGEALILLVAVVAPTAAAGLLWRARALRRRWFAPSKAPPARREVLGPPGA